MNDTVRIERPFFSRRLNDTGGRIKHDARGNPILVKTRSGDSQELPTLTGAAACESTNEPPSGSP